MDLIQNGDLQFSCNLYLALTTVTNFVNFHQSGTQL